MSVENPDQFIPYDDLVAQCEAKGIEIVNNAQMSARMPQPPAPAVGMACAMTPEGYTNANQLTKGGFLKDLGPPALQLRAAFGVVAPDTPKFAMDFAVAPLKPPGSNG